jgi:hypothetical protein
MNYITIGIGVLILCGGLIMTYLRFTNPQKLTKLEPMKQRFGATAGSIIHGAAYSVLPIVAGTIFIITGVKGHSLF